MLTTDQSDPFYMKLPPLYGNDRLSIDNKEEIQLIFHKSLHLLISSTININNINLIAYLNEFSYAVITYQRQNAG